MGDVEGVRGWFGGRVCEGYRASAISGARGPKGSLVWRRRQLHVGLGGSPERPAAGGGRGTGLLSAGESVVHEDAWTREREVVRFREPLTLAACSSAGTAGHPSPCERPRHRLYACSEMSLWGLLKNSAMMKFDEPHSPSDTKTIMLTKRRWAQQSEDFRSVDPSSPRRRAGCTSWRELIPADMLLLPSRVGCQSFPSSASPSTSGVRGYGFTDIGIS